MPAPFIHTKRVEFHETDLAGLMHFSNYFRFMESAEHAFLRSIGHSVHATLDDHTISYVRVHADCDYRQPLHFEEEVAVAVQVQEITRSSIRYRFTFHDPDQLHNQPLATGHMTVVCVRRTGTEKFASAPIPEDFRAVLQSFVVTES